MGEANKVSKLDATITQIKLLTEQGIPNTPVVWRPKVRY